MDLGDYMRILRRRWPSITACVVLALSAATVVTLTTMPSYVARAQLFVSAIQVDGTDAGALQQGGQFVQERVLSYAQIVDSPLVTTEVVRRLDLPVSPEQLAQQISASAPRDTVLIDIDVTDESPSRAQAIANAVAERFAQVADELESPDGDARSPVKVSVVRDADLPVAPASPRTGLNLALGLLFGLAVGVGSALLREALDTSVKGVDDVQTHFGLPTLGLIGFDPQAPRKPLIARNSPSARSEAFRQLRTNLQFVGVDHRPRSIVITSSVPEEGKSTTVCNLASTLSQTGQSVVVLEADLRRPRLRQYLGLEGAAGLTDVLVGRVRLDDVLQPWGSSGTMHVLPSGPTPPNPSELLGSMQMKELLKQLEDRADLVLIDAPPLLPVTDGAVLAALSSGTVLVVRAGRTSRAQLQRAVELLAAVDAHVYGVVLNMVPSTGTAARRYGDYVEAATGTDRPRITTRPVKLGGGHRRAS